MARSIATIQAEILADLRSRSDLDGLTSTSATALYLLITFAVAAAIATLENIFDVFRVEISTTVASLRPHTLRYYQAKAKAFRLGVDLAEGDTVYPDVAVSAEDLAAQQIIAFASVTEAGTQVQVKVAKADIEPLTTAELAAFTNYIQEVKDAGVRVEVTSEPADRLRLTLSIYYDPNVLDATGRRLDGTNATPVLEAVEAYTEDLRFDGQFVNAFLQDRLQLVDGVRIPHLETVEIAADGDPNFVTVQVSYTPSSGFVRLYDPADLTINYLPYADA